MGASLDWQVWRYIVDYGIKRPDLIREQVQARQAELQAQRESADGEITHARRRLAKIDQERTFYQRQAARGKITEMEFDARMDETEDACKYWQSELACLRELRDGTASGAQPEEPVLREGDLPILGGIDRYRAMVDAGRSAGEVYLEAQSHSMGEMSRILLVRTLFGLSLHEAGKLAEEATSSEV